MKLSNMNKLKLIEWIQLGPMFFIVLLAIGVLTQLASPDQNLENLGESIHCYLPFYSYSGNPGYIAAICSTEESALSFLRIHATTPESMTSNSTIDIASFFALFVAGCVSWLLFIYRALSKYVPGL